VIQASIEGQVDKDARKAVFRIRIRIRIHMFFGLPNPDPLVRGMDLDLDPDPSIIMQKIRRKTLNPTILSLFLTFYL
jgi:hypothetical protein